MPSNSPQYRQFEPHRRAGMMSHIIGRIEQPALINFIVNPLECQHLLKEAGCGMPSVIPCLPHPASSILSCNKSPTARPNHSAACPNGVFAASHTRGARSAPAPTSSPCHGNAGNASIDSDKNRLQAPCMRRMASSAAASLSARLMSIRIGGRIPSAEPSFNAAYASKSAESSVVVTSTTSCALSQSRRVHAVNPHPASTMTRSISSRSFSISASNRCCALREKSPTEGAFLRNSRSCLGKLRLRPANTRNPAGPRTIASAMSHLPTNTSDTEKSISRPTPATSATSLRCCAASTTNTRSLRSASAAARFTATVVAPTPVLAPATTIIGTCCTASSGSTATV
jgi:hypothetical protein